MLAKLSKLLIAEVSSTIDSNDQENTRKNKPENGTTSNKTILHCKSKDSLFDIRRSLTE